MADDMRCINTVRCLCADMVQKANSGHPGAPMGMAPMAHVLWGKGALTFSPVEPKWPNRDRFVLSNGHACALQYSMLHLIGHKDFPMSQLEAFRTVGSKTPGHPENILADGGVEVTTGPLGQGFSNAVGLAIASAHLGAVFNKPEFTMFDNFTYCFAGDGCLQEGITSEAASLAGHLGLGRLIVLYDDNQITIDGGTSLSFTEDVPKRFEAYGWHTLVVEDGDNDVDGISAAIKAAQLVSDKPTLITVRTTIGYASSKQGTQKAHGAPLGEEDLAQVKTKLGLDPKQHFAVPNDVRDVYVASAAAGNAKAAAWRLLKQDYDAKFPEAGAELSRRLAGELPEGWERLLPTYQPKDAAKATRQNGQDVIKAIGDALPELVGGSADLNPSTLTYLDGSVDFQRTTPEGRNIRFGVREHAMAAICNGLSAYGGIIPYNSTFLNFIQYMLPAVRLSALSHFGVIYIMTHDSIGLGEDGPTHQPISALMTCRAIPNVLLLRPADGNETAGAYAVALKHRSGPSVICLSRQGLPNLANTSIDGVSHGAYTIVALDSTERPDIILVGTGSETSLCVEAAEKLGENGTKAAVVSMPSWELFEKQPLQYQLMVFPNDVPVLAVEAGSVTGWREYAHACVGMTTFGTSGPVKDVLAHFGFTANNVAAKATEVIKFYEGKPVPSIVERPRF